jgi:hypothetical protein
VLGTDTIERCLDDIRAEVAAARRRLGAHAQAAHGAELLAWGERLAEHLTGQASHAQAAHERARVRTAG